MTTLNQITREREAALKIEGRKQAILINNRYHTARMADTGVSHSNLIHNRDMVEEWLSDHENGSEIAAILSDNPETENNGFRLIHGEDTDSHISSSSRGGIRLEDDLAFDEVEEYQSDLQSLNELQQVNNGTERVIDNLRYYLGDLRAWRNGFNPKSFYRHVGLAKMQLADNGLTWGKYCDIKSHKGNVSKKLAILEAKRAKRKAKAKK